jgi:acyl carrier protein
MSTDFRNEVRQYIETNFILGNEVQLGNSDSLLDLQLIDSTGFLELVGFMEDRYGIKIADDEMVPENLDSLDGIERFIRSKLGR